MTYYNKITLKKVIGGIIAIFFLTTIPYLVNIKINYLGTPNDWCNFATYIAGIGAALTVFVTVFISYLVYKLSEKAHNSEYYFEKIVEHYMELQKNHDTLFSNEDNKETRDVCKTNIKMHVQLLRYYLNRYPDLTHPIREFDLALNHIWFEPMNIEHYKNLPSEFELFCFYANNNQKRPIKPIKDKKGNVVDVDY